MDWGVGRINVEKRFLREATPVIRGDSDASKYSSDGGSSGLNTDWSGGLESRTFGSL